MIDIAAILTSVAGKEALTQLLKFFKGNKKQLQKAYEQAFQNAVQWYENRYDDEYGTKNNRFFDYDAAAKEFAKLLFLHREPNLKVIAEIEFEKGRTTPVEVVQKFIDKLRNELSQIPECEAILVERKKFNLFMGIKNDTSHIPKIDDGIQELIQVAKRGFGL